MIYPDSDSYPLAVDGAELLDRLGETFEQHLILRKGCAAALALWTIFTYAIDAFDLAPIVAITSPTKRCGKSTLLILLRALTRRALIASNLTGAVLFRLIEQQAPTLLVDEGDSFLTGQHRDDALRGILNAGHTRKTAFVLRNVPGPDGQWEVPDRIHAHAIRRLRNRTG